MNASSLLMVIRSRTFGMLCSMTFSGVSNAAVITGNAEFFAPAIATVPCNGLPPLIRNLSMRSLFPQRPPQIPLRQIESGSRVLRVEAALQHDQSDTQAVSRLTQSASRRRQVFSAGLRQHAQTAVAKFLIRQRHVDHQVLIHMAEPHKRGGGEHVQD